MKVSRLNRVLANMEKEGLCQILVTSTESIYYLTGLWIAPGERMLALRVAPDGCRLYVNRMFALGEQAGDLPLAEFDDGDDPIALLAEGVSAGKLGVDKAWPSQFSIRLMEQRPDVRLAVGSAPVDRARMLKDEEELRAMRAASRLNDEVVGYLPATLRAGDTELAVGRRYEARAEERGAQGPSFAPLVCFGKNCAEPHHETGPAVLKPGDAVILDLGLTLQHACSDMTRTVFFLSATDEQKRVYDIVRAANRAGKDATRPGARLSDIDRAARRVIEEAGYGRYFLHRTGHGIGLQVHEPPDVSVSSDAVARPGMTFSIEPGIYLADRFGVRVEDLVAVTEDGCEVLNHLDRELRVIR